ncbi:hybrid sensor histidine kinase/response regulator [Pseudoprimorskyibacter insulae]|nr:PAS domain-containing hybrid sensor histidine kinase/response regulator [Pseudoprimorskyibacter insulae]
MAKTFILGPINSVRAIFPAGRVAQRLAVVFASGVILVTLGLFGVDLRRDFRQLESANSDNILWVLSQTEIEITSLEMTLQVALTQDEPNLNEIRKRFDILYSRVETLSISEPYADLRQERRVEPNLAALNAFIDKNVTLIDSPDETLLARLPDLAADTQTARQLIRGITAVGIQSFSIDAAERRDSLLQTIVRLTTLLAALVLVLVGTIVLLIRLNRAMRRSALAQRLISDRMESIVATSLDAVIVIDRDGHIIVFNDAASKIFGYSRAEAMGAEMSDLLIPDKFKAAHVAGMSRYRKTGKRHVIGKGIVQLEGRRKDGSIFPVDLTLSRAHTVTGEIFVSFIRDISDRVQAENDLRQARDKAIAGEKSKAELLAVMSHEMRTPLNGLLGTLELINFEELPPKHRAFMEIIRKSGKLLLGHVNDVLEISRLDVGKVVLNKQSFDLVELMEDVIATQTGRARAGGTELVLAPPHPDLHHVYSDPHRLQQVLLNLIGNAIKFTRNGRVTLEAECLQGRDEVMIRVIDTGIGIPEEDQERIFGDFETIDTAYSRSNSGTGLGLGISKRLTTLLGGTIGVESEPGEGSVFWITLPLMPPEDEVICPVTLPQPTEALTPIIDPITVLVVEDNEINRFVARSILEQEGHTVIEAHDGAAGIAAAQANDVDLILMDISMPGMDGLQATRAIRKLNCASALAPVVATTAHAFPDEIAAFRDAGMNDVLAKPLSRATLRKILADTSDGSSLSDPAPTAPAKAELLDEERLEEIRDELPEEILNSTMIRFEQDATDFFATLPDELDEPLAVQDITKEAHKLAGTAAVFGAKRFRQSLNDLELKADQLDPAALRAQLQDLKECWADTLEAMEKHPRFVTQRVDACEDS